MRTAAKPSQTVTTDIVPVRTRANLLVAAPVENGCVEKIRRKAKFLTNLPSLSDTDIKKFPAKKTALDTRGR